MMIMFADQMKSKKEPRTVIKVEEIRTQDGLVNRYVVRRASSCLGDRIY